MTLTYKHTNIQEYANPERVFKNQEQESPAYIKFLPRKMF